MVVSNLNRDLRYGNFRKLIWIISWHNYIMLLNCKLTRLRRLPTLPSPLLNSIWLGSITFCSTTSWYYIFLSARNIAAALSCHRNEAIVYKTKCLVWPGRYLTYVRLNKLINLSLLLYLHCINSVCVVTLTLNNIQHLYLVVPYLPPSLLIRLKMTEIKLVYLWHLDCQNL